MTLEEFILTHRAELDREKPPEGLWKQLGELMEGADLERFVLENKAALNALSPGSKVWKLIEQKLDQEERESDELRALMANAPHQQLNPLSPPSSLWQNIERELEAEETGQVKSTPLKMVPISRIWQLAAVFLMLIIATGVVTHQWGRNAESLANRQAEPPETVDEQIARLAPELVAAENYYSHEIGQRLTQMKQMKVEGTRAEVENFAEEVAYLDRVYEDLKKEFVESQANDRVLSALIDNLQLRTEMLNRQLHILQQIRDIKNNKSKDHEINL